MGAIVAIVVRDMNMLWPILKRCIASRKSVAVIDDNREYTYGKLLGGSIFVASRIEEFTAKKHVGIMLPTSGAFPMALLGTWLAGRVAVPLNYLLSPDELQYVIQDSGIDTIITAGAMLNHLGGEEVIPDGVKILKIDEFDFTGFPPLRWPPRPKGDDLAAILYTSGTSGRPKGVMLSHGNFSTNVNACISHAGLSKADVFLGVLPQFHSFGLMALTLLPLQVGSTVVYSARFIPKRIIKLISKHRPQVLLAVPSMYGAMLSVKSAAQQDLNSVRLAISAGEPLPDATFEAFQNRFDIKLLEGYGLTETSPVANWGTPEHNKRHSVGRAIPGVEIAIVDDTDQILPTGDDGEILIAGPNIMQGYYQLPEQTASVFVDLDYPKSGGADSKSVKGRENGSGKSTKMRFFRSGDIGHVDDDGFLFITGRKKEMLIIAGENVFPREIEEVLNKHEAIHASAVIGKIDGMRGEVPVAFIELEEDAAYDAKSVKAWCREHLAQFKVPRDIRVVDELPRNPTGKIMRRALNVEEVEEVAKV
jgi:long-chain acyl-CoA synthetase